MFILSHNVPLYCETIILCILDDYHHSKTKTNTYNVLYELEHTTKVITIINHLS